MSERCVLVFTKPARPGRVKTRLIGELTPGEAADLHAALLADVIASLGGGDFALHLAWALDDGEEPPTGEVPGLRQSGRDLGERLYRGLSEVAGSHRLVAAVGSDHPDLEPAVLEAAFAALDDGTQVVLGPATDGGYYLIALRSDCILEDIFQDIPWSTERVLAATLERCRRRGLTTLLLPERSDVDTAADLERLARRMASQPALCPRTRELLESWRRLPVAGPLRARAEDGACHAPLDQP